MRLATPTEMTALEKVTIEDFKISAEILMENAGAAMAREIQTSFLPELQRGRVAVVCGPGNNGGDGMAVARHLTSLGFSGTEVFLVGRGAGALWALQRDRLKRQKINVHDLKDPRDLHDFDLFVDGLFGIGLSRPVGKPFDDVISYLNSSKKPVISIDIPSGLNGLTGRIEGVAVKAQMTLTLGAAKPGLLLETSDCVGRLRVLPIAIPREALELGKTFFGINEKWVRNFFPVREKTSNKFSHGRLAVLAGKPGMWGAAALCCNGAYRAGAGYVTLLTDDKNFLGKEIGPDILTSGLEDKKIFEKSSAFVVGPGAGVDERLQGFIKKLLEVQAPHVVLDADGITVLAQMLSQKKFKLPSTWILTPHAGELSRLTGMEPHKIESHRYDEALKAASMLDCQILLKGYRTLIVSPSGSCGIVLAGNAALAKAGTGDVLSGFIGAFLAQGVEAIPAAALAAFLHGRMADRWVKEGRDMGSLMASDLVGLIPEEVARIKRG